MDRVQWLALPKEIAIRELRYRITIKGMRTREVTIATTLLDPMRYPKHEIVRLCQADMGDRNQLPAPESNGMLRMDILKCKDADGVARELMVFALVYDLVRAAMTVAAEQQGVADANRVTFMAPALGDGTVDGTATGTIPRLMVNPRRPGHYDPQCSEAEKERLFRLIQTPLSLFTTG